MIYMIGNHNLKIKHEHYRDILLLCNGDHTTKEKLIELMALKIHRIIEDNKKLEEFNEVFNVDDKLSVVINAVRNKNDNFFNVKILNIE